MKRLFIILFITVLNFSLVFAQNKLLTETNDTVFTTTITDSNIVSVVQNTLIGDYLIAYNITSNVSLYTTTAIGNFNNPDTTVFQLDSGLVFCTGDVNLISSPNNSDNEGATIGSGTDADLQQLLASNYSINDAVIIEFDYIPFTNIMSFSYIFGSEEFPEFVNSPYNDLFGFFVSGNGINGEFSNNSKNIALLPDSSGNVSIDNVYLTQYYIDNTNGLSIQYDGFTTALDAVVEVTPFTVYHIKLAVGDAGDSAYDTGVFLKNNSFSSWPLQYYVNTVNINELTKTNLPEAIEDSVTLTIDIELPVVATADITYRYQILGTAINGVDYQQIADSIIVPADSNHASIIINALSDAFVEGTEQIILVLDYLNDTIKVDILDNTEVLTNIVLTDNNKINIYPNPATNQLTISSEQLIIEKVEILDITGKMLQIYQEFKTLDKLSINISSLDKGIYFIRINNESISRFVKE